MPDNEVGLMEWQIGKQSVFSTKVTPTVKMVGVSDGTITPDVENTSVEEDRGSLTPTYDVTQDSASGSGKQSLNCYAEMISYALDCLFGQATPSGAGPYVRAYTGPGSKPTALPITLVRGSSEGSYALTGATLNEIAFKNEKNKKLTADLSWIGCKVEEQALASLGDPATLNMFHANQLAISIDAWTGTMGGTLLNSTSFSWELGLNFNKGLKTGLGSLNPKGIKNNKLEGGSNQLKLSVEFEADQSKAFLDSMISTAVFKAQVQLLYTVSENVSLKFEYAGFSSKAPEIFKDDDGVAQMDMVLDPLYHATLGSWLKITLMNGQATTL